MDKLKNWFKANKETIEGWLSLGCILVGTYLIGDAVGDTRGYYNGYESGYRNGIRDICDIANEHAMMR